MIRVLEYPKEKRIRRCSRCLSLLEYYKYDVKFHQAEKNYDIKNYWYITCPVCYMKEKVSEWQE